MKTTSIFLFLLTTVSLACNRKMNAEKEFAKSLFKATDHTAENLFSRNIEGPAVDSRGRLFFLTYGGLSIYDGTRFLNYQAGNGLAHDLVNDVLEITPDSFLIATNTNKLNALVNGHITTVSTIGDAVPVINKFFRANDGKLYVSGDEGFYWLEGNRFRNLNLVMSKDTIKLIDRITE